jgi:magnesium transporter
MKRNRRNRSKKVGLPPGALVPLGEVKLEHAQLSLFCYAETSIHEQNELNLSGFDLKIPENGVLWLNIHGLHDTTLITEIGRAFNLHPLVLEDILNTDQRPKLDTYDNCLFFVTRFFH